MGAAIEVFEGARALRVPRTRFAPVKTTDDLLALRSDAYELTDDARVVPAGGRTDAPFIALDPDYYKLLRDFEARFPAGPAVAGRVRPLRGRGRRDVRRAGRRARLREGRRAAHRSRTAPSSRTAGVQRAVGDHGDE